MSFHEYKQSQTIAAANYPFYALIMAAMRQADTENIALLKQAWPKVYAELLERYYNPGGALTSELDKPRKEVK